jgi:ATP-dependent Lon protease
MECRRRVKDQQKRIGSAEFRNTHFSYQMGLDGIETFVVTPEAQSNDTIGTDPLPPGQVWAISPGGQDESPGLYRIDVNGGPGAGVKIINVPVPGPFRESIKYGEQNLLTRAKELVGDRDPRQHEFTVQLRAFDAAKSGSYLGLPALLAFCSLLLSKSLKGGLIAVGGLNLGGGLDPVYNAVGVAEAAVEKGAATLLIPISARKQLNDLSDDMAMRISIVYYADAREALLKALSD